MVSCKSFPSDIIEAHLLQYLTSSELLNLAMGINKQWSDAAINVLSTRTEYLSLNKLEMIHKRAELQNHRLSQLFCNDWNQRHTILEKYSECPLQHPLRFRALKRSIIVRLLNHSIMNLANINIYIAALVIDSQTNTETTHSYQRTVSLGSDIIIQTSNTSISISEYNGIDFSLRYAMKVQLRKHEHISYYSIQLHREDLRMISLLPGAPMMQQNPSYSVIPISDFYVIENLDNFHLEHQKNINSNYKKCIIQ